MPAPLERFHLRTLGPTGLWHDDRCAGESLLLPLSKPLALLAYLELASGGTILRDEAVDLLWANADGERARQSLRQCTWHLRKRLGAEALVADGPRLALAIDIESDRRRFLASLEAGEWARAIELYRGPYLEGFAAPGAGRFELWADLQREHLAARYRAALEQAVLAHLQHARWREARTLALALRDADPFREGSWRMLLEALLAGGDRAGALLEAEALSRAWSDSGRPLAPETRRLLAAVHESDAEEPASERPGLVAELVGRSREFGTVIEAWHAARAGRGGHVRVAGHAGMGKSRLLDDLRARLLGLGATVVAVRANPGERAVAFACAAELARALGGLPGAKGVSESDAATLVGLVPALSATFAVKPDAARGAELLRRRASALAELLACVADEQPVALLLDDVHWADDESRVVLSALLHRVESRRALAVTAERPVVAQPLLVPATRSLELQPLTAAECEALMGSLAALPAEPWTGGIGGALRRSTGGSPLLLLETLRLALERGWLALGEEWSLEDAAGWNGTLHEGSALIRRLEALSPPERLALANLAVWGRPAPEARLLAATGVPGATALAALQRAGFAVAGAGAWGVVHDEVADAVCRLVGPDEVRAIHARIGTVSAEDPLLPADEFPATASHLVLGASEPSLGPLFRRWLVQARAAGLRGGDRELARLLLGAHASGPRVAALLRARPWRRRLRPLAAAAAALAIVAASAAALSALVAPSRLVLATRPVEVTPTLLPDPVVEVQDGRGRRVIAFEDTVVLSSGSPWFRLEGGTLAVASEGRARFRGVRVVPLSPEVGDTAVYRFEADGLPVMEWRRPNIHGGRSSALWLLRGSVNGQPVDSARRSVHVRAGDSLRVDLELRYTSAWPAASVILGGTTTWQERERAAFAIKPLVTPQDSAVQHVALRLAGPSRPGRYPLILFFDAEDGVEYIASGTNWLMERPVWHDGNDVLDWTEAQLERANRVGSVAVRRAYPGPVTHRDAWVPATVIYVEARAAR